LNENFSKFRNFKKKIELFKYAETKPSEVENSVYVAVSSDKVLIFFFFVKKIDHHQSNQYFFSFSINQSNKIN